MTHQLLWALSNLLRHVFRNIGQVNSRRPGLGEGIEVERMRVERERGERRRKEAGTESGTERKRNRKGWRQNKDIYLFLVSSMR